MKKKPTIEIYMYFFFIVFALVWINEASKISMRVIGEMYIAPSTFPKYLSIAMIILCVWEIADWLLKKPAEVEKSELDLMLEEQENEEGNNAVAISAEEEKKYVRDGYLRIGLLLLLCIFYVTLYKKVGYLIMTALMVAGGLIIFRVKSPIRILLTSVITSGVLYYVFVNLLSINLP